MRFRGGPVPHPLHPAFSGPSEQSFHCAQAGPKAPQRIGGCVEDSAAGRARFAPDAGPSQTATIGWQLCTRCCRCDATHWTLRSFARFTSATVGTQFTRRRSKLSSALAGVVVPDQRIVAVGLLTQANLNTLGPALSHVWPVEEAPISTSCCGRSTTRSARSSARARPRTTNSALINSKGRRE